MTVTECVQSVLAADGTLAVTFPEGQIFAPGQRQAVSRPYIVHFPVTIEPASKHGLAPSSVKWGYQVSIYASTLEEGEEAALTVITALHGKHQLGSPVSDSIDAQFVGGSFYVGRDDEEDVEHFALSFMVHKSL